MSSRTDKKRLMGGPYIVQGVIKLGIIVTELLIRDGRVYWLAMCGESLVAILVGHGR